VLITVGLTPEQEAAYALSYGVDKADLSPQAQTEYDRLLAAPPTQPSPAGQASPAEPWAAGEWFGLLVSELAYLRHPRRLLKSVNWRHYLAVIGSFIVGSALLIAVAVFLATPRQASFQKLQTYLAQVHFPPGYRLVSQHRAGPDCVHQWCVITQRWQWGASSRRTTSRACADVFGALNTAFSDAAENGQPTHSACDYYAVPPINSYAEGKPSLVVVVWNGQAHAGSGFLIVLTAGYGPNNWPPITGS